MLDFLSIHYKTKKLCKLNSCLNTLEEIIVGIFVGFGVIGLSTCTGLVFTLNRNIRTHLMGFLLDFPLLKFQIQVLGIIINEYSNNRWNKLEGLSVGSGVVGLSRNIAKKNH